MRSEGLSSFRQSLTLSFLLVSYFVLMRTYISDDQISYHVDLNMDLLVSAVVQLFGLVTGVKPKFKVHGGSQAENLALQNIQVRYDLLSC